MPDAKLKILVINRFVYGDEYGFEFASFAVQYYLLVYLVWEVEYEESSV